MDLKTIYEEHKNQVYNLALQYVQNTEDAEEITQDVFIKVHKKLSDFKHQSKLSTWIYRITVNQSLDHIKAKKRQKRFAFITQLFNPESGEEVRNLRSFHHPGIELEQKEDIKRIFDILNELPERQKTVIILAKIEYKSQAEIAEIMDISIKAVESLISRAKKQVKIKLNEGK